MKRLPDHIEKIGAGFNKDSGFVTADLIKRKENVAIYLRTDGYYEVGVIFANKDTVKELWGKVKHFTAKENYFSNNAFGKFAKCTHSLEKAEEYMEMFLASEDKAVRENRVYTS